jgi:hypothetical protein
VALEVADLCVICVRGKLVPRHWGKEEVYYGRWLTERRRKSREQFTWLFIVLKVYRKLSCKNSTMNSSWRSLEHPLRSRDPRVPEILIPMLSCITSQRGFGEARACFNPSIPWIQTAMDSTKYTVIKATLSHPPAL